MADNAPRWSYEAAFEANPISASQARGFVSEHLFNHGLPYLVNPVRLVASELVTNALLHANTAFHVTLSISDETVLLTVRDDSPSLPLRRTAQATDTTGRGLEIVDIVSLDWGIRTDPEGSKAVWASFSIRDAQQF